MTNIKKIIKELSELTILEAAQLVKSLEQEWGICMVNTDNISSSSAKVAEKKKKTDYDVILTGIGNKKIQIIKIVREITSLGLKDAKCLVDSYPKSIKKFQTEDAANEAKEKLEKQGATVSIK